MLLKFYLDENGFIVTVELLLIVTIVVIGLIAGLAVLRDAVNAELIDIGNAIQRLNQETNTSPSILSPRVQIQQRGPDDFGDSAVDDSGEVDNCVQVFAIQ